MAAWTAVEVLHVHIYIYMYMYIYVHIYIYMYVRIHVRRHDQRASHCIHQVREVLSEMQTSSWFSALHTHTHTHTHS